MESGKAIYFEDEFGFDYSNGPREPQFREESVLIHGVIVTNRDVFYLVVDEPIVSQNDLVVDE